MTEQKKFSGILGRKGLVLVVAGIAVVALFWVMQSDNPKDSEPIEGDYLPIVKVAPVYPEEAVVQGLTGHCDLEFTVTPQGTTTDISVIECTDSIFEPPSVQALLKFKYKPRVANGAPVAVSGVRNRFTYTISG